MPRRSSDTPPLTKRLLDSLEYPYGPDSKREHLVPDHLIPRHYVRVYPSGAKKFIVRAYINGTKRSTTIGDCAVMTLKQAREAAREALLRADRGESFTPPPPPPGVPTFNEFVVTYFERHAKSLRSADEQERLIARQLAGRFGKLPLDEITVAQVADMKGELSDTPYEANRARDLLSTIINKALEWGTLPASHANPVRRVKRFTESPRERVLTNAEVQRLVDAIDEIDSEHTRVLFRVLLDLPLRKNEIMRATWEGFDADTATLRVTSLAANKGVYAQALPKDLVDQIKALPKFDKNPFIFPSRDRKSHIRDIDSQWKRIKEIADVSNARLHDLRRTIATEYARLGASEYQIQSALGQKTNIAARHYVHLAAAEVNRELMERRASARGQPAQK